MTLILKPAVRRQSDDKQDLYSDMTALDCSHDKDVTRQEDKDSTDVNVILSRFGVPGTRRRPLTHEVDFDLDLQTALAAVTTAKAMMGRLPKALQEKYHSWQQLLNAAASGQLQEDLDAAKKAPAEPSAPKEPPPPA